MVGLCQRSGQQLLCNAVREVYDIRWSENADDS